MDACPDDDELADFIAAALDESRHADVEAHIAECPSCRRFLAEIAVVLETEGTGRDEPLDAGEVELRAQSLLAAVERYIPTGVLGTGGMGIVYQGRDTVLDRTVALKMMLDAPGDVRQRLRDEAQTLAQLSHPNVVRIFDVQVRDAGAVLVHELVEGDNMTAWLREQPRSWTTVVDVLVDAAAGLEAAHAAGIVHRDVTPNNIVVGVDGRARVIDFGLARGIEVASSHDGPTPDDENAPAVTKAAGGGTPGFVAPEVLARRSAGPAADQYGLCATAYFALTGSAPTADRTRAPLRVGPKDLARTIERGLSDDPKRRFASMAALQQALLGIGRKRTRNHRLTLAAAAALGVATWAGATSARSPARLDCDPSPHLLLDEWLRTSSSEGENTDALARYADDWRATTQRACETGGPLLPARAACLRDTAEVFRDTMTREFRDDLELERILVGLPSPAACDGATRWPSRDELGALRRRVKRAERLRLDLRVTQARSMALEAAEQAESIGVPQLAARAYQTAGLTATNPVQTRENLPRLERAYALAVQSGSDRLAMHVAMDLAMVEAGVFHPEAAKRWLGVAGGLVERQGGWVAHAVLAARQANFERKHGSAERASELASEALHAYDSHGASRSRSSVVLRKGLGQAKLLTGAIDEARGLLVRAGAEALAIDQPQVAASAYHDLARTESQVGNYAAAAHWMNESVRLTRVAYGPTSLRATMRTTEYGMTLLQLGDTEGALQQLEPAVARLRLAYGDGSGHIVQPMINLGIAYASAKRFDDAKATLWRAMAVVDASGETMARSRPSILQSLGWVEEESGNRAKAAAYYREAIEGIREFVDPENPTLKELRRFLARVEE